MKLAISRNPLIPTPSAYELIAPGFYYVEKGIPVGWKAWMTTEDGTAVSGYFAPFAAAFAFLPSMDIFDRVARGNAREVMGALKDALVNIVAGSVKDLVLPIPGGILGAAIQGGVESSLSAETAGKQLGGMLGDRFALYLPLLDLVEWEIEDGRRYGFLRRSYKRSLRIGTDSETVGRRDTEVVVEYGSDDASWPRLPFILRFTCEWETAARMAADSLLGSGFSLGAALGTDEILPYMPTFADLFSKEAETAVAMPRWALPSGITPDDALATIKSRLIENGVSEQSALPIAQVWFYWRAIGGARSLAKPNLPIQAALLDAAFRERFEALVQPSLDAFNTLFPPEPSDEWLQVGFFINTLIAAQEDKLAEILGVDG